MPNNLSLNGNQNSQNSTVDPIQAKSILQGPMGAAILNSISNIGNTQASNNVTSRFTPNIPMGYLSSDKDKKKDVEKDNKIKSFLDAVDPVSFEYKKPDGQMGKTQGEHLGVIAQDIEKAPHGKSMILDTQQGKAIDIPSAVGTLLAAAADANRRMSELEEYLKARKEKGNK